MDTRTLIVLGLLVCSSALADPPDTEDLEALLGESIVTTASRSAERASVAPSTVFTITADEIYRSGARTLDEALELLGLGIYVTKTRDYTSGIDVGAQGLLFRGSGRHVLVLLDGVILNSQGTGRVSIHEGLGVPLDLIEHIEVLLGPGSVIYGSNAMLAVINIVTRRAKTLPSAHVSAEFGTAIPQDDLGRLALAKDGHRAGLRYRLSLGGGHRFQIGKVDGEVTAMLEFTHERSATYGVTPFTQGEPYNQSFFPGQAEWGGLASHYLRAPNGAIGVRLGDFRLLLSGFYYDRSMPLVGTFMDPYAREIQYGGRVDLSHSILLGKRFTLDSRVYGGYAAQSESSNYGEDFWCLPGQDGCHLRSTASSGWAGLEQRLQIDWLTDGKVVSMVGYDLRPRLFSSTPAEYRDLLTNALPDLPLPQASDTSLIAAIFVQQVWRPLSNLAVNVGGRLDIQSQFGVKFSPRAALVYSPISSTTLRASYNEAFRAPSLYELTEFDPTYRITPQSLRPETVRSVELEITQRISRLQLAGRAYASFYEDLIEGRIATAEEIQAFADRLSSTVDPEVVVVNDNITRLRVFGGSLSAKARLPLGFSLALSTNLSRAYANLAEGESNYEEYERLPLCTGNFHVGWQSQDDDPAKAYSVFVYGIYSTDRLVLVNHTPTEFRLGPRLDLRLSAAGPIPGLSRTGLRFRASIGYSVNHELPYAVTIGTDTERGFVAYPGQSRLYGFFGLVYSYAGR